MIDSNTAVTFPLESTVKKRYVPLDLLRLRIFVKILTHSNPLVGVAVARYPFTSVCVPAVYVGDAALQSTMPYSFFALADAAPAESCCFRGRSETVNGACFQC